MRAFAVVLLAALAAPAFAQSYRLPLELGGSTPYVTAYRDLSGSGGGLRDWSCGTNTYDGHRGTDIGIGGFAAMDAGSRWVVAAAPGTVTAAVDGCFDRCTSGSCSCGAGFGNSVRVRHADGKSTWYGHLMNGSVTVRNGDVVTCGQRLGRVGSSGNSTGPHLHFEPRYGDNTSDDPFAGPCGGPESFWVEQGGYRSLPVDRCEGGAPPPPPPARKGVLKGVVFDRSASAGPNDAGNVRVAGARIEVQGSLQTTARAGDAYFELELDAGTYTYAASADGFEAATRTVTVVAGMDVWGSIGVARVVVKPPPPPPAGEPVGEAPVDGVDPAPVTAETPDAPAGLEGTADGGCRCVRASDRAAIVVLIVAAGLALRRRRASFALR